MVGHDSTGQRKGTTRELERDPGDGSDFRIQPAPLMRSASVSKSGGALGMSYRSPPGLRHPSAVPRSRHEPQNERVRRESSVGQPDEPVPQTYAREVPMSG